MEYHPTNVRKGDINMDTAKSLYEIEIALAKHKDFNFVRNIVAYNVNGESSKLPIFHECDMLVLNKSGYLTEIEIKRSWADFVADFKKDHGHDGRGLIKYFYYCIPECLLERAYDKLESLEINYTGIITYSEDLKINIRGYRYLDHNNNYRYICREQHPNRKLFIEEQLQVARFGAMRSVMLKEKLINSK